MKEIKANHYVETIIHITDRLLRNIKTELRKKIDDINSDITSEQFIVLDTISCYSGIYQQKLSDVLMKDKSNTTRILKLLESKNLIKKEAGNKDGRLVYRLYVTEKGNDVLNFILPKIKKCITDIFASVTDEEIDLLHGLSKKFEKDLSYLEK